MVDVGPLTKLLPTLRMETHPSTIILVADDDFIYSPLWAAELLRFSQPTKAFAVSSFTFTLAEEGPGKTRAYGAHSTDTDAASQRAANASSEMVAASVDGAPSSPPKCWSYKASVDHGVKTHVLEAYLGVVVQRSMFSDRSDPPTHPSSPTLVVSILSDGASRRRGGNGPTVEKPPPLPPFLPSVLGRFINYMARAAGDWTKNGPWMLADDLVVSFYLNHSGVELFNVRCNAIATDRHQTRATRKRTNWQTHECANAHARAIRYPATKSGSNHAA